MTWIDAFSCFLDQLLPRTCPVCGDALNYQEKYVCIKCMLDLPQTHLHEREFNTMEQLFAGKTPIERAAGYFFYTKESPYSTLIHDIKYRNRPKMGQWLASEYAREIKNTGFFDGIDMIIPVPLHKTKIAKRGYNQSQYIAQGISEITGIPVVNAIIATKSHETQTHKGIHERWLNTQNLYSQNDMINLEGKHVIIIDDVITTGATLLACAKSIDNTPGIKISLLSLAVAQL
ncbi:MAG: ComF family protein [Muribaculaceae bacterium]